MEPPDYELAERIALTEPSQVRALSHPLRTSILSEPEVWGVETLGAHGVAIRLVVKTLPADQYKVMRVLRERIKDAFDTEGIEIPFPQQTVWVRGDQPGAPPPPYPPAPGQA